MLVLQRGQAVRAVAARVTPVADAHKGAVEQTDDRGGDGAVIRGVSGGGQVARDPAAQAWQGGREAGLAGVLRLFAWFAIGGGGDVLLASMLVRVTRLD